MSFLLGEIGNIVGGIQRNKALGNVQSQEKKWESLTPQQLAAKVSAATQPLSQGLTQSVGNVAQAEAGERGLAQAPGIFTAILTQLLAPYYQQNQNTAEQLIQSQMGLPVNYASAVNAFLPQQTDLGPLAGMSLLPMTSGSGGGNDFLSSLVAA